MQKTKLKKIVLFTGYACSNHCRFCIDADKRNLPSRSTAELIREIYAAAAKGADILEMIGGESTMRRDFRLLVKTAKKLGIKEVLCATNGRAFADKEYARSVLEAGLDSVIFSLHGPSAKIHDMLTEAPGSFDELCRGIENFMALGCKRIYGNTAVVKQNFRFLPEIAKIYARRRFTNVEYIFVDPTYGGAFNDFDAIVPKISEVAPFIRKAIDIGMDAGLTQWKARYVPLCHFPEHLDHISEINERQLYVSEHWAQDFINEDSIGSRNISRRKGIPCKSCALASVCEGLWNVYLDHYGEEEMNPFTEMPIQMKKRIMSIAEQDITENKCFSGQKNEPVITKKEKGFASSFPFAHLTVFPGPACNLSCSYCYLRKAPQENADGPAILRGIAEFINFAKTDMPASNNINGDCHAKITFLGGEPLLQGRWLKKWILAARKLSPDMPLRVFTNGTLLNQEWFSFFEKENVSIALSLDGRKACNDQFRHFKNNGQSVYDAVLASVPQNMRSGIDICSVVCPETASLLGDNLFHIASLGFGAIGWAPDMSCFWPDESLSVLKESAISFRKKYLSYAASGSLPFRISNMYETLALAAGKPVSEECDSLALSAAGKFYPCDKLLSLPLAARAGHELVFKGKLTCLSEKEDNEKGYVNSWLAKRNSFFANLSCRGGKFHCNACLAGTLARLDGLSMPECEKKKIFESQEKLADIVRRELSLMAEEGLKIPVFRKAHAYSI